MTALARVADLVRTESGMTIEAQRHDSLMAAIGRVSPGAGPDDFLRAVQAGRDGRALLEQLVDEVTVNETYFFRERGQIDSIPWHDLLDAAYRRGADRVRVWSAACSTGEEAYTLAMSAYEAFGPLPPPVEIVGTDIAPTVLIRARGARYRERAVREISPAQRERWLVAAGTEWEVAAELRRLVTFARYNLVREVVPPGGQPFDLIVCRNVLIYFDSETARHVVATLRAALHPHGRLVLGSADALGETSRALASVTKTVLPAVQGQPRQKAPAAARRPRPAPTAAPGDVPEPLDAAAHFLRGIGELDRGAAAEAVESLRHALWLDGSFGLAAFALGRAHDLLGDRAAAARAYRQALRTLGADGAQQPAGDLAEIAVGDVAAACRARLGALAS